MNKKQYILLAVVTVTCLMIIGAALMISNSRKPKYTVTEQRPISKPELVAADGKNGRPCYVAVSGTVYEIKDSSLWQNGRHSPSKGMAYCGADMTKVIGQSPHGTKILKTLPTVGPYIK